MVNMYAVQNVHGEHVSQCKISLVNMYAVQNVLREHVYQCRMSLVNMYISAECHW